MTPAISSARSAGSCCVLALVTLGIVAAPDRAGAGGHHDIKAVDNEVTVFAVKGEITVAWADPQSCWMVHQGG